YERVASRLPTQLISVAINLIEQITGKVVESAVVEVYMKLTVSRLIIPVTRLIDVAVSTNPLLHQ
ncbi:MAG: hypothetical protein WBM38_01780, partial [Arenicellales bacterium]